MQRPPGEVVVDEIHGRSRRMGASQCRCSGPKRASHDRRDPFGLGDAGQLHQPGAISVFLAEEVATSTASRVLPTPPAPTSVTSRQVANHLA